MRSETHPSLFTRDTLPKGWKTTPVASGVKEGIMEILSDNFDGKITEIPRSSNSITFLLESPGGRMVYQYGPAFKETPVDGERQNPNKFKDAQRRVNWLHQHGVTVPFIHHTGEIDVANETRAYIAMDFMPGEGGDSFLIEANADLYQQCYKQAGDQFGRLAATPLHPDDKRETSANDQILINTIDTLSSLEQQGVFDQSDRLAITKNIYKKLITIPDVPSTYVHVDPFPVNWQVQEISSIITVGLLDIEAIRIGHPLIEGIGRAAQWAARDWFSIIGTSDHPEALPALINGFNQQIQAHLQVDPEAINRLTELAELVWLPQAILYELMKEAPEESPERRKAAIMKLVY